MYSLQFLCFLNINSRLLLVPTMPVLLSFHPFIDPHFAQNIYRDPYSFTDEKSNFLKKNETKLIE